MSQRAIRIENPQPNTARFTTEKQAQHYVSRRRAVMITATLIRFLEQDHRNEAAERSAKATALGYTRTVHHGIATRPQLRGVPFVGDIEKLYA